MQRIGPYSQRGWAWLPAAIAGAAAVLGGDQQRKMAHEQMDAQREFAQMGIRWKVADAKAAGVHPLFALGANTTSFSPISVGGSPYAEGLREMGQEISRARAAQQTQAEREADLARTAFRQSEIDAMNRREHEARLRGMELDNANTELRNAALFQQLNSPTQVPPPRPASMGGGAVSSPVEDHRGRVDSGAIVLKPVEQNARDPQRSHFEAGSKPGWERREVAPGQYIDVPTWQTDAEIPQTLREMAAYWKKWVSDTFFNGAPRYINIPSPTKGRRQGGFHQPPN